MNLSSFIESLPIYQNKIKDKFVKTLNERADFEDNDNLLKTLTTIAMTFEFDLRSTEQWIHQLYSCYAKENSLNETFWLLTSLLIALKKGSHSNYEKIFLNHRRRNISYENLNSLYAFSQTIIFTYRYEGLERLTWTKHNRLDEFKTVRHEEISGTTNNTVLDFLSKTVDVFHNNASNKFIYEIKDVDINKNSFQSLLKNERVIRKAELENYIDLVEMASDLT